MNTIKTKSFKDIVNSIEKTFTTQFRTFSNENDLRFNFEKLFADHSLKTLVKNNSFFDINNAHDNTISFDLMMNEKSSLSNLFFEDNEQAVILKITNFHSNKNAVTDRKINTISIKSKFRFVFKNSRVVSKISNNDNQNSNNTIIVATIKTRNDFRDMIKTKKTVVMKLNMLIRRYYIAYLFNNKTNEFVMIVLSNIKFNHSIYKTLRLRCSKFYKQWKTFVLDVAQTWMIRWIHTVDEDRFTQLINMIIFNDLKHELEIEFHSFWLENVFRFVVSTIDFVELSKKTLRFSRCKSLNKTSLQIHSDWNKRFRSVDSSSTIDSITRNEHQKRSFCQIYSRSFVKLLRRIARKNEIRQSKYQFVFEKKKSQITQETQIENQRQRKLECRRECI